MAKIFYKYLEAGLLNRKALDKYFLMVVFILLPNKVHAFAIFVFIGMQKNMAMKELNTCTF